jgi:hypothetical protein
MQLEVEAMARASKKGLTIDFRPAIETLGLDYMLDQIGLDRLLEHVGADRLIEFVGEKEVLKRMGLDRLLANLSPADRRELKRRL